MSDIDWTAELAKDKLELDDEAAALIGDVDALWRKDMDGDPLVEVRVVLRPEVDFGHLDVKALARIDHAISQRMLQVSIEEYPYIRYFSPEDWESFVRGDTDEEDEEAEVDAPVG
jgi:hypothetical protein